MSSLKRLTTTISRSSETGLSAEQQQSMVDEVRELLGPLAAAMPYFVTDATIRRFLAHKNWRPQKASKTMREAINWRMDYKPEAIRWEDVVEEAKAGKIYRADYSDKQGRPVLIIRPGSQKPKSAAEQLRCFVYHLENAAMSAAADAGGGQVALLTDFHGWAMSTTPVRESRSCLHIIQSYYPGIVGVAIIHDPPKLFHAFWKLLRPFLDDAAYGLARFVYAGDAAGRKVMEESFDVGAMEEAYGGKKGARFDAAAYGERMTVEDRRMEAARQRAAAAAHAATIAITPPPLERQLPW